LVGRHWHRRCYLRCDVRAVTLPAWRDWVFALKVCAAALLALFVALWMDLPRPYWAVSTVFIIIQPLAGATRSKAIYRVYGTLLGAIVSVILIPNLVNAPEVLTVALALWVGLCLYFSLLDRTPRSYVLMLAGYTSALVGFPTVADPGTIFDTAVARAEEITLGILCASLVGSIVLPQSVAPLIKTRLDQWFSDARAFGAAVLARSSSSNSQTEHLRLASGAIGFDALATPLRYDMTGAERSADAIMTLRQHMLMFLPIVASIADRIEMLERMQALPDALRQRLDDMAAWLRSGTIDPVAADRLRRAVADNDPVLARAPAWSDLVVASLAARLGDFIDLRQDARGLQRHIVEGTRARETLAFRYTAQARRIRHHDHTIALLSALAAFIAVVLASAIWIATAWPEGSAAPMLAAVGASFFAAQDDPAPQIVQLANAGLIGAIGAGIYLFGILPVATSFEMLALALAPALIACGLLMTQPRTGLLGLGLGVVGFTVLAIQDTYTGEFAQFANSSIAVIAGLWISALVTRLMRSVGAAWSARRLRRINRRSLADAALGHDAQDGLELAALMLDRVGLIAPRISTLPPGDAEWTSELVTEVRVGINLVPLRRVPRRLARPAAVEVDALLSALADYFRTDVVHPPDALLGPLDAALDAIMADEQKPERRKALLALTDLRCSLFPNAPPYSGPAVREPGLAA
jgi:uncharacterized membrane protein YccC